MVTDIDGDDIVAATMDLNSRMNIQKTEYPTKETKKACSVTIW